MAMTPASVVAITVQSDSFVERSTRYPIAPSTSSSHSRETTPSPDAAVNNGAAEGPSWR